MKYTGTFFSPILVEFGKNLSPQVSKALASLLFVLRGWAGKKFLRGNGFPKFFTVLSCSIAFLPSQLHWSLAARKFFENAAC